ncbi:uncharacterized protein N7479_004635 [Penicillium vulpinum]|uniref:Uncharacterized protein n=1 Tax=Penicillium vulpinum TaxID=29845 RepID=A0A1V6RMW4_9EURO|nr:uncharacterized protein N7479_004635 [Penicillium vulpinum]KAJ5964759.1 hypothetical protein N7479_004635 [Penicillium vulpinum]OQE02779.1 hypothetical protein PENVUL_c038G07520 [Penicillium vulpinum]
MANPIPVYVPEIERCKHCEVEGHSVIDCSTLYEDLTNFRMALQAGQGPAADPKDIYPVARWGKSKKRAKAYGPVILPHGTPYYPSTYGINPNDSEAYALENYVQLQQAHSLWYHAYWSRHAYLLSLLEDELRRQHQ